MMADFLKKPEEIKQLTDIKGGCIASNKITVDGEKVGYAYRENPDGNFPNDSGWRFLSGTEDNDYSENPNNFNTFELNTICNYDSSVIEVLSGKIGQSYIRKNDKLVLDIDLPFPIGATDDEKKIDWKVFAEISDKDLGFDFPERNSDKCRFNTRIILRNADNKICIIKSMKYGYCQIPGGGIDGDESIEEGLRREASEETGFEIDHLEPLGATIEYRNGSKYDWVRSISFCFAAETSKEIGTSYMEDEVEEGFEPIWIDFDEALKIFEDEDKKLQNLADKNYSGTFSTRRDLSILKFLKSIKEKGENTDGTARQ